jgi:hypothetical protein
MQTLSALHDDSILVEEEKRHGRRLLVGILCALLLTSGIFGGYLFLRKRHERQVAAAAEAARKKALAPRVEIYVDDPTLNDKKTLLGGELHNISNEPLRDLAVELELTRRNTGKLEKRVVTPEQTELGPDARTRYGLELLVQDYASSRLVRIVSGDSHADTPFKAFPGAPRPPMEAPASKTVIVNRPRPARGEEFLNSPDKPARVP